MKILALFIFSIQLGFAQVSSTSPFEYTQKIRERLSQLEGLTSDQYLLQIEGFRTDMERYFDHKKRVCNGEFSTVILSESGSRTNEQNNRLTADEKKLCFRELKAMQSTYLNNLYTARERYLDELHKNRKADLQKARERALQELDASFAKQIR